ncbi:MAG: hypothetical protein J0I23_10455 [Rhizobiales bacterium]|nr:hypothetical protein [Hyphomicrobiales bacterium]
MRFKSLRNDEAGAQDFIAAALKQRSFDVSRVRTDAARIGHHSAISPATAAYDCSG